MYNKKHLLTDSSLVPMLRQIEVQRCKHDGYCSSRLIVSIHLLISLEFNIQYSSKWIKSVNL